VRRLWAHYGGSPLHLLVLVATFALGGYTAWILIGERPVAALVWFGLAVVGHDLVLLPLYALGDRGLVALSDGRAGRVPWINYVRVPAAISLVLLLVFLPSIFQLASGTVEANTALHTSGYLASWLGVTGALFLLSAVVYAAALLRAGRRRPEVSS
jgi:hypothetical protein